MAASSGRPGVSLEARILAVCDVYDALLSNRVYRDAFSNEAAMEILRADAGTKLDRRCVATLERIVATERALRPSRSSK